MIKKIRMSDRIVKRHLRSDAFSAGNDHQGGRGDADG